MIEGEHKNALERAINLKKVTSESILEIDRLGLLAQSLEIL